MIHPIFPASILRFFTAMINGSSVNKSILVGNGDVVPVTKSGYGLVHGTEPGEKVVAEIADVTNPDRVADLIMSRLRATKVT